MKKYICPNCESRNSKPYCNDCDCSIPNDSFIEEAETVLQQKIICSACGRTLEGKDCQRTNCPHCGELLLKGSSYKTSFGSSSGYSHSQGNYTLQYILSVLIPLCGFIMGAIYLTKKDESHVGSTCIVLGVLSFVLSYIILSVTGGV